MHFQQKKAFKKLGDTNLLKQLSPEVSNGKPILKLILWCVAFILITIGLANPQIGTKLEEVKREGVDVIIALDISNSMRAEDIRPNRLEKAKQAIARFIDRLENDRIGIIVFAGRAYVQLPITSDFNAAKLFLGSIDPDLIPTQGTAIGAAIDLAVQSFVGQENKYKTLVIITDGENHEDDALESARNAVKEGIIIHTIGMGSPEGAPIPISSRGAQSDFLKDAEGSVVVTKLDQAMLEQLASEGKGIFVRASNGNDALETIMNSISKMEKRTIGSKQFSEYEDRFQYFLAAGLFLLLLEFMISNRKSKWIQNVKLLMSGK
jgi:Ca-activated chloride channel family protein